MPLDLSDKRYNFRHLRTMVVDDHEFMRRILADVLKAFGFERPNHAEDGREAIDILRDRAIDLIFTDWNMAGMDGLSFVQAVRDGRDGINPYLPIVMVSGYREPERVMRAGDAGVHIYLAKPISANTLYARLSDLIENPPAFVRGGGYFGPERRRHRKAVEDERRAT